MSFHLSSVLLKLLLVMHLFIILTTSLEHTIREEEPSFGAGTIVGELFNKSTLNPTNYTIRYKYTKKSYGGLIIFTRINVDGAQNSSYETDYSKDLFELDYRQRSVDATISVVNATNLTTSIELGGLMGMNLYPNRIWETSLPRSYAFICTTRDVKVKTQQKRLIEFGKRLPGDIVVRIQNEHSDKGKLSIDFQDPQIKINYISLTVDSPWAVVFTNKIVTTEDRLQAVIYALDHNDFQANLLICGIKKF